MMSPVRFLALLCLLVPAAVLGQGTSSTAAPATPEPGAASATDQSDPMAAWTPPRKMTPAQEKQGRQQVLGVLKKMEQASQKGDLDAAVAVVDFPVLMLTDTKAGEGVGGPWSEEQWRKVMEPFYAKPMKDMKVTHAPKVSFVTEALATVEDNWTMTMGKKKTAGRSAMLVVKKGGDWKVKAMVEGGWGDMAGIEGGAAGTGTGTGTDTGTTSGSAPTGTDTGTKPSPTGTDTGTKPSPSGTDTGTK